MSAEIVLLGSPHLSKLIAHLARNAAESARDGDYIFRPRNHEEPFEETAARDRHRIAWGRKVGEPLWARTWGLIADGHIRGHVDLHGGMLRTEQHRTTLGIGIERPFRARGHGRALIQTAIGWARGQQLTWMDLGVFAANAPARALYGKLGFVEVGLTRDRYRVDGHSIDDIAMTLAL